VVAEAGLRGARGGGHTPGTPGAAWRCQKRPATRGALVFFRDPPPPVAARETGLRARRCNAEAAQSTSGWAGWRRGWVHRARARGGCEREKKGGRVFAPAASRPDGRAPQDAHPAGPPCRAARPPRIPPQFLILGTWRPPGGGRAGSEGGQEGPWAGSRQVTAPIPRRTRAPGWKR